MISGVMVDLDSSLPFTYGQQGRDIPIGSGQADIDSMGMTYLADAQFPVVGNYWVRLDLGNDEKVQFQVWVKPAD